MSDTDGDKRKGEEFLLLSPVTMGLSQVFHPVASPSQALWVCA